MPDPVASLLGFESQGFTIISIDRIEGDDGVKFDILARYLNGTTWPIKAGPAKIDDPELATKLANKIKDTLEIMAKKIKAENPRYLAENYLAENPPRSAVA